MSDKPEPVRCNECETVGAQYELSWGGITPTTCMAFYPFLDADGRRHYHDGNSGGGEYWRCSNGHMVTEPPKPKCWCGWPVSGKWVEEDRKREEEWRDRHGRAAR